MKDVHAGTSFIQRWQRQYYLKRLEEQAEEASAHAALDDLEQVRKSLSLVWQLLLELQDTCIFQHCHCLAVLLRCWACRSSQSLAANHAVHWQK